MDTDHADNKFARPFSMVELQKIDPIKPHVRTVTMSQQWNLDNIYKELLEEKEKALETEKQKQKLKIKAANRREARRRLIGEASDAKDAAETLCSGVSEAKVTAIAKAHVKARRKPTLEESMGIKSRSMRNEERAAHARSRMLKEQERLLSDMLDEDMQNAAMVADMHIDDGDEFLASLEENANMNTVGLMKNASMAVLSTVRKQKSPRVNKKQPPSPLSIRPSSSTSSLPSPKQHTPNKYIRPKTANEKQTGKKLVREESISFRAVYKKETITNALLTNTKKVSSSNSFVAANSRRRGKRNTPTNASRPSTAPNTTGDRPLAADGLLSMVLHEPTPLVKQSSALDENASDMLRATFSNSIPTGGDTIPNNREQSPKDNSNSYKSNKIVEKLDFSDQLGLDEKESILDFEFENDDDIVMTPRLSYVKRREMKFSNSVKVMMDFTEEQMSRVRDLLVLYAPRLQERAQAVRRGIRESGNKKKGNNAHRKLRRLIHESNPNSLTMYDFIRYVMSEKAQQNPSKHLVEIGAWCDMFADFTDPSTLCSSDDESDQEGKHDESNNKRNIVRNANLITYSDFTSFLVELANTRYDRHHLEKLVFTQYRPFQAPLTNSVNMDFSSCKFYEPLNCFLSLGENSSRITIFDINFNVMKVLHGHSGIVMDSAYLPQHKMIVTCHQNAGNLLRFWSTNTPPGSDSFMSALSTWKLPGPQHRVCWTGYNLCTADSTGSIYTWNVQSGEVSRVLSEHTQRVDALLPIPQSHFLVSGALDASVRLWDDFTGKNYLNFTGHTGGVAALASSHSYGVVASGGADDYVMVWSPSIQKPIRKLRFRQGIRRRMHGAQVQFGHIKQMECIDNELLVADQERVVRVYDMRTYKQLQTFTIASPPQTKNHDNLASLASQAAMHNTIAEGMGTDEFNSDNNNPFKHRKEEVPELMKSGLAPLEGFTICPIRLKSSFATHHDDEDENNGEPEKKYMLVFACGRHLHRYKKQSNVKLDCCDDSPVLNAHVDYSGLTMFTLTANNVKVWDLLTGRMKNMFRVVAPGASDDEPVIEKILPNGSKKKQVATNQYVSHGLLPNANAFMVSNAKGHVSIFSSRTGQYLYSLEQFRQADEVFFIQHIRVKKSDQKPLLNLQMKRSKQASDQDGENYDLDNDDIIELILIASRSQLACYKVQDGKKEQLGEIQQNKQTSDLFRTTVPIYHQLVAKSNVQKKDMTMQITNNNHTQQQQQQQLHMQSKTHSLAPSAAHIAISPYLSYIVLAGSDGIIRVYQMDLGGMVIHYIIPTVDVEKKKGESMIRMVESGEYHANYGRSAGKGKNYGLTCVTFLGNTSIILVGTDMGKLEAYFLMGPFAYLRLFAYENHENLKGDLPKHDDEFLPSCFTFLLFDNQEGLTPSHHPLRTSPHMSKRLISVDDRGCIKIWDISNLLSVCKHLSKMEEDYLRKPKLGYSNHLTTTTIPTSSILSNETIRDFFKDREQSLKPILLRKITPHSGLVNGIRILHPTFDKSDTCVVSWGDDGCVLIHNIFTGEKMGDLRQGYAKMNRLLPTSSHWKLQYDLEKLETRGEKFVKAATDLVLKSDVCQRVNELKKEDVLEQALLQRSGSRGGNVPQLTAAKEYEAPLFQMERNDILSIGDQYDAKKKAQEEREKLRKKSEKRYIEMMQVKEAKEKARQLAEKDRIAQEARIAKEKAEKMVRDVKRRQKRNMKKLLEEESQEQLRRDAMFDSHRKRQNEALDTIFDNLQEQLEHEKKYGKTGVGKAKTKEEAIKRVSLIEQQSKKLRKHPSSKTISSELNQKVGMLRPSQSAPNIMLKSETRIAEAKLEKVQASVEKHSKKKKQIKPNKKKTIPKGSLENPTLSMKYDTVSSFNVDATTAKSAKDALKEDLRIREQYNQKKIPSQALSSILSDRPPEKAKSSFVMKNGAVIARPMTSGPMTRSDMVTASYNMTPQIRPQSSGGSFATGIGDFFRQRWQVPIQKPPSTAPLPNSRVSPMSPTTSSLKSSSSSMKSTRPTSTVTFAIPENTIETTDEILCTSPPLEDTVQIMENTTEPTTYSKKKKKTDKHYRSNSAVFNTNTVSRRIVPDSEVYDKFRHLVIDSTQAPALALNDTEGHTISSQLESINALEKAFDAVSIQSHNKQWRNYIAPFRVYDHNDKRKNPLLRAEKIYKEMQSIVEPNSHPHHRTTRSMSVVSADIISKLKQEAKEIEDEQEKHHEEEQQQEKEQQEQQEQQQVEC